MKLPIAPTTPSTSGQANAAAIPRIASGQFRISTIASCIDGWIRAGGLAVIHPFAAAARPGGKFVNAAARA